MKNKKLLSTVVAAAMVASTMVMPVMAVDSTTESGHVDAVFETKTAVIRVVVPTSMAAAVNQFEVNDAGSQIYSDDFTMDNKSEIPVKVNVTSTATIKSGNTLLATKAEAASSTNAGEAWLAVAAQISDGAYISGTNDDGSNKTIADLDDTSENVTTFTNKGTEDSPALQTDQTFYLDKSSSTNYKLLNASEDASKIDYAEFHLLTPLTITGNDDTEKENALKAEVAKNDVYSIATGDIDDGEALAKIAKGTTTVTYAGTNTYYRAAAEAVVKDDIDATKLYMYGDEDNSATAAKGKAAFRYIGKLSEGQDTWTKADISNINVAYAITGVKGSTYDAIPTSALTYGLYKDPSYLSATTMTASSNSVTLSLPTGVTLTKVELTNADGTGAITLTNGNQYTLRGTTFAISGSNISTWTKASPAKNKIKLTYSDNKSEIITLQ